MFVIFLVKLHVDDEDDEDDKDDEDDEGYFYEALKE